MILDTTNISSGSTGQTVVVEKWVWEWYQDALNIARSQLAKLEVENRELKQQLASRDEYTAALHKDYQRKDVENRALKDQVERLSTYLKKANDDLYKARQGQDTWRMEAQRLEKEVDKHWVYLEDVILGMVDASDRVREVAKEIKLSRGTE